MNKIRTVVVEDEPVSRDRLLALLGEEEDIEVVGACADGREAAEAIVNRSPDLVFLDIQLPEMSGLELARRLEGPLIPGGGCSIAHAYVQVCMHSQGHRSQCATRLRSLGGQPPVTDFIVWLQDRPVAQWTARA